MSQVKDFRASILKQQIMELQRFLKALEHNNQMKQDSELGLETLTNIEFQLRKLRQDLRRKFMVF